MGRDADELMNMMATCSSSTDPNPEAVETSLADVEPNLARDDVTNDNQSDDESTSDSDDDMTLADVEQLS